MTEKYYCYICKKTIYGRRETKKHALLHFNGERCPYCGMKTRRFIEHFVFYHLQNRKKTIFNRDLAILCREFGNTEILNDKDLNLNRVDKIEVRRLLRQL